MSLESLYHETNRRISEVHSKLAELASNPSSLKQLQKELQARIEQILSNCERLDILVNKEPAVKRHHSKIRLDQLKYDVQQIQTSLNGVLVKQREWERRERERDELLQTRFTTNSASSAATSETSILIDKALEHNDALNRSHRGVDDLLSHGATILESLRDQRMTIKGIKKKVLDVASILGMSNTVMRLIERRSEGDKYILIGCMVFTCIVMYIVVKFFT